MITRKPSGPFPFLAVALLASAPIFLAGCMTDDEEDASGPSALVGQTSSALTGAKAALAVDGKLYVANRDSSANGLAVMDLATGKVIAFHKSVLPPNELALDGDSVLVVSETDHSDGALSRLGLKSGAWQSGYKVVDSDNSLTSSGGSVFLMERTLGVVAGFTGGTLKDENVTLNVNTGAKSNPSQTAVHGKTAFVTRFGSASLLVLEADKKDGGVRDSIDLSGFVADSLKGTPGAVPNMDAAVIYGDKLFVTVQRLTGWDAKDTSKVVIIDAMTREVVGEIPLLRKNPFTATARGKYLYVSCVEEFGTFTGAVERIDMEKAEHAGLVVEETDLTPPSDVLQFVPVDDSKGYVIHTADFITSYIDPVTLP